MFHVGEKVNWIYKTGWGGGETRYADAEIMKINRVKIRIKVFRKQYDGSSVSEIKNVLPSSLEKKQSLVMGGKG